MILYGGILLRAQLWTVFHVSWSWHKTASTSSEIISQGVWDLVGIGEGANVIISKYVIRLDSRLLRVCNWSVLLWTVLDCYRVT